jgi:glutathione peroxidase
MSVVEQVVQGADGAEVALAEYAGKVLLVVNTATQCGFTPQYAGLQELYARYRDEGFEILDFPCNQFGHQAPGSADEIASFCETRYGITFRQFAKIDVNGPHEAPLYTWLKAQKSGVGGSRIKWNFTKFLIGRDGEVVARFGSQTKPEQIAAAVAAELAK